MARFGVLCLPLPSHLNLFFSLSRTLAERGHSLVFFGIPEIAERVRSGGCEFRCVQPPHGAGSIQSLVQRMGDISGLGAMRLQLQFDQLRTLGILESGPRAIRDADIQLLLVDQAEAAGGSVAEHLRLPWVSVSSGLCLNAEPRVPPFFTSWGFDEARTAVLRNQLAYGVSRLVTLPIQRVINRFRRIWNLQPLAKLDDTFSPYAQICQQIAEFDFPRRDLPGCFHYVGPISSGGASDVPFPWEALDGRPIVYASLGTLLNQHQALYRHILDACAPLPVQLVLSLGGGVKPEAYQHLPGKPVVVSYAPQRELLKRVQLTISHAGLNTTLESLWEGTPLVAIPITFEQPAIAARIRWTGTGDFISPKSLNTEALREMIVQVMRDARYRSAAQKMKVRLREADGCSRAAEIIEQVLNRDRWRDKKPAVP